LSWGGRRKTAELLKEKETVGEKGTGFLRRGPVSNLINKEKRYGIQNRVPAKEVFNGYQTWATAD